MNPFFLSAADGTPLSVYRWEPQAPPRAVVQIVHGLGEHAGRYAELAAALNRAGYAVGAADLRGHGHTAARPEDLGFFADRDGWRKCLDDVRLVQTRLAVDHPGLPIFLVAHSMGSFLAQQFITEHGDTLAGVVLCASDGKPSPLAVAGRLIARFERRRLGPRGRSRLIHFLAFGLFNRKFRAEGPHFQWLSRDPEEIRRYAAEPLCGFVSTTQLWIDLLDALGHLEDGTRLARIPKSLPIHLISGTCDAVSDNTKRLKGLIETYRRTGLEHVTHLFYPGARHELFHEINREEVTRDLISWLDRALELAPARLGKP